jgi:hypothetical protein
MHYKETKYGFEWGAAEVTRCFSDAKGWVTLLLETPKHKGGKSLQIYVTKTGKVRIFSARGEWKAPTNTGQTQEDAK